MPAFTPHTWTADQAIARISSSRAGLSEAEARSRLDQYGPNALPQARPRSAWLILVDQLRSVVVVLLAAAAAVAAVTDDSMEAAAIGAVLLINTTLGFLTELRARRAVESLARLQPQHAIAIRDGRPREIDARELVPGDVIELDPGRAVPADARLIESADLTTVEAALTGESMPVSKNLAAADEEAPLAERHNMVYQGTTVATGTAQALVASTGTRTELGRIGELTATVAPTRTPLERRLDRLGHRLVWIALGAGAAVGIIGALRGMPLGQLIETGLALAIAAVPEGLPIIATIALAVGVRRMARRNALIRRLPSAETLGSVTVICTDKTGTLTAGVMTATVIALDDREISIAGAALDTEGAFLEQQREIDPASDAQLREALIIGALANHASLITKDGVTSFAGDPTEAALLVAAARAGLDQKQLHDEFPLAGEVPFSSQRMLMATFHRAGSVFDICAKGAPDRLLERCTYRRSASGPVVLDEAARERLLNQNTQLASRGLRVLALAKGRTAVPAEDSLRDLTFVAFVGLIDPPAPGVKETISAFSDAGIRTVMLTGDQQLTALAVAKELGIAGDGDEILDSRRMLGRPLEQLLSSRVSAFSRVDPEAKLSIVRAFQQRGEIVAVLGDGVNDAPALRQADIGVAMGLRGTDVAKDAAGVVLLDDRFSTVGVAVEQGRVIFDNIRKFVFYLFSCNLGEVLVLLIAGVAGLPLPLLPLQILWINIVTDTFPALALAIEPGGRHVMDRAPRNPEQAILSARFLRAVAAYGFLIAVVTVAAFWIALEPGETTASTRAQTMAFMTLALAQVLHLGNARSQDHVLSPRRALANPFALGAVGLVVFLQVLAVHVAPLAGVLRTEALDLNDWGICLTLAAVPAVIGQALRWRMR